MSRVRAAVLVLALVGAAPPAGAQDAARARARVQSLEALHASAEAAATRTDSARIETYVPLREGLLTFYVAPGANPAWRRAMRALVPAITFTYGDAAAALSDTTPGHEPGNVYQARVRWDGRTIARGWGDSSETEHADALVRRYVEARLAPDFQAHPWARWGGTQTVAPFTPAELARGLTAAHVQLVTAPSPVVRRCFLGDVTECRRALVLAPTADPALEWYSAAARREVVGRLKVRNSSGPAGIRARECVRDDDEACIETIRGTDPLQLPAPLEQTVRQSVLRHALRVGGPGAYARFLAARGAIGDVLAATAAVPLDSLVAGWRGAVVRAAPDAVTAAPAVTVVATFWALVIGAMALGSSRWNRL